MRYCTRCVMPDTKPGIIFNSDGVCSACVSNIGKRMIDWDERGRELRAICDSLRGSNGNGYDCIVPVSGGKDSTYQAYVMKHVYKMNTLCVCIAPHVQTEEGIANLNAMVENVGVDLIKIVIKPETFREVRRRAFFMKGEPNWAEHLTVFSSVARTAMMYRAPLVVWGEDIAAEFGGRGGEKRTASAENIVKNDLIKDDRIDRFLDGDSIKEKDIFFYRHPDIEELKRRNIRSIYLGYYHWWDGHKNYIKAKELGFTGRKAGPLNGNLIDYDNIDEKLCEINIWFKFLKFGFWRPTDQACYQLWNDRMTRAEAVKVVNELQYQIPSEYIGEFCEFHKVTEKEFWENVDKYRNKDIFHQVKGEWRLKTPLV